MAVSINLGMGAMPGTYAAVAPGPVPLVSVPDVTRPPSRPFTPIAPLAPIGPEFGTDRATAIRERMARRPAPAAGPASVAQAAPAAEPDAPRAEAPVPRSPGGLGGLGGLSFGDHISALGMSLMTGGGGNYLGNYPQALENIRQRRQEEEEKARAEALKARQMDATVFALQDMGFSPDEAQRLAVSPDMATKLYELREKRRVREADQAAYEQNFGARAAPQASGEPPPLGWRYSEAGAPAGTAAPAPDSPPAPSTAPADADLLAPIYALDAQISDAQRQAAFYESRGMTTTANAFKVQADELMRRRELMVDRLPKDSREGGEFGLTPVYMRDPETGDMVLGQLSKNGGFRPIESGSLVASPGVQRLDLGTSWGILNRSGEVVGTVEKDVAGEQREQAVGRAEGETIANAPAALRNAESVISVIDNVLASPGRAAGTGFSRIFNAPFGFTRSGSDTANFEIARDQLQGLAFLQAYASLKGGGPITEVEGLKAEQAEARLNPNQSDEEFERALLEMRDIAVRARDRAAQLLAGESVRLPDGRLLLPNGTPQGQESPPSSSTQPRIISVEPVE